MKLDELTTPFESFRVVTYNADKTKAIYKNKQMQLITGNIYRGETIGDECNKYCDVYACYDEVPVGIWAGSVYADYSIEEVMEQIMRKSMETLKSYMAEIKHRLEKQDYFSFTELEFIKHTAPELETPMWESRKAFVDRQEKRLRERREQQEAEERAFVRQENSKSEQAVNAALNILRNGGKLENQFISFYESRYNSHSYSIVNYLMRKYGVNVPTRTQGWINSKLVSAEIENGKCEHLQYQRVKGAQCSQKFFECMNALIAAVSNV